MKTVEAKTVLLGAQGVGKTSITLRYVDRKFYGKVTPTIGAAFISCKVNLEDYKVKLQVWDTAGQERFRSMAPMFYRSANAAILVFDLTSASSFHDVKYWVKELRQNIEEKIAVCVVGNKLDLESREISKDEATSYAQAIGADYVETSAISSEGIDDVFQKLAVAIIQGNQALAIKAMQTEVNKRETSHVLHSDAIENGAMYGSHHACCYS